MVVLLDLGSSNIGMPWILDTEQSVHQRLSAQKSLNDVQHEIIKLLFIQETK